MMSGFWTTLWWYLVDTCSRLCGSSYEAPSGVAAVPVSEDVLMEIFSRMPAESVHQCMLAYEDWNALLSTPYFNHNLFLPRASTTIIVQRGSLVDDQLFYIEDDHRGGLKSKQISAAIPGLYEKNYVTPVSFTCHGLIFIHLPYSNKINISIVNPITRRWLSLRFDFKVQGNICGVFFHPTAREFRVLWVSLWITSSKKAYVEFKMLRPRSEEHPQLCWKALSKLHSRPMMTYEPPVNLHDCLHWMCYEYGSVWFQRIMVFSTVKEEFKLMPSISSEEPSQDKPKRRHLLDLDGYLSLWELTDVLNIWAVEDYNVSWSWTKRYTIEVKLLHKRVKVDEVSVVGFQNGALVIHWIGKGIFVYHLQHRTTKRFLFNKLRGRQNGCFTIPFLHTNSLVSMDGFTRDEYKNRSFVM